MSEKPSAKTAIVSAGGVSVYVDDMRAPFGRLVMCHMIADSTEELLAMADKIGVARRWIQKAGTSHEHFDVCLAKRALAVRHGAQEVDSRGIVKIVRAKRERERERAEALKCEGCGVSPFYPHTRSCFEKRGRM